MPAKISPAIPKLFFIANSLRRSCQTTRAFHSAIALWAASSLLHCAPACTDASHPPRIRKKSPSVMARVSPCRAPRVTFSRSAALTARCYNPPAVVPLLFAAAKSIIPERGMHRKFLFTGSFLLYFFTSCRSSDAQLPPLKNPLTPAQNPAAGCSTTDASSCAQVAAKLLPIVMGQSPMEENLRRLTDEIGGRVTGSPEMAKAVEWAVAAFRAANVDVHTEKYTLPVTWNEGKTELVFGDPSHPFRSERRDGVMVVAKDLHSLRVVSEAWGPPNEGSMIGAMVVDVGYGSDDDIA